jgi:hypothetical protein
MCMIAEYIRALEGIGFDWEISMTALVSIWSVRFQQLCDFKTVSCQSSILPTPSSGIGFRLSAARNYRLYQEGKSSPLTEECIRELESVGFKWNYVMEVSVFKQTV